MADKIDRVPGQRAPKFLGTEVDVFGVTAKVQDSTLTTLFDHPDFHPFSVTVQILDRDVAGRILGH